MVAPSYAESAFFHEVLCRCVYECYPDLITWGALRACCLSLCNSTPKFSVPYIFANRICGQLRSTCLVYSDAAFVERMRGLLLSLRVLLRIPDFSDPHLREGCLDLVGMHACFIDAILIRSGSCWLRSEGGELLQELADRLASVGLLLRRAHVDARNKIIAVLGVDSTPSYRQYVEDSIPWEALGDSAGRIPDPVLLADYAIRAMDIRWTARQNFGWSYDHMLLDVSWRYC